MLRVDFLKVRITSESQTSFNKEKVQSILHATRSADESRDTKLFRAPPACSTVIPIQIAFLRPSILGLSNVLHVTPQKNRDTDRMRHLARLGRFRISEVSRRLRGSARYEYEYRRAQGSPSHD